MTRDDDQLRRLFEEIRFVDEPPFPPGTAPVDDDLVRARRLLRKRRLTTWGAAAVGSAMIVSGVAVAVPNLDLGEGQLPVAEEGANDAVDGDDGSATDQPSAATNPAPAAAEINPCPTEPPPEPPDDMPAGFLEFEKTRHCLLEVAVEHFDPEWKHLPDQSTNGQGGGSANATRVGTKLGWSVQGEDGLGMVQVAVTTPGYSDDERALFAMPGMMICTTSPDACRSEPVPDTDEEVLVVEDDAEYGWALAVAYQRPDGSMVSVAVDDLFGNNSVVPVSEVDITLEQAIAFVTDPALRVDESEAAQRQEQMRQDVETESSGEADYSDTRVIPAPDIREMTDTEAQEALKACVASVPAWSDFQPEFGVWMTTQSGEEDPLVIAEQGDKKMECRDGGAALFGTPEVKGSPYLRGPVSYNNMSFGRYVSDVEKVIVQPSGGPMYEAVMKDGYWFLPAALGNQGMSAIRGYDAAGEQVYDSTTEDRDQCYTDPDGNEVVFHTGAEVPPVEDCVPALEWGHP